MKGRQRRVRSDSLANLERLMQTAARLFSERGVSVPLDEIAAASGLGSATLHRHFQGRTDLVHAVLDAEATQLIARAGLPLPGRSPDQALRAWLTDLIRFSMSYRGLAVLLARGRISRHRQPPGRRHHGRSSDPPRPGHRHARDSTLTPRGQTRSHRDVRARFPLAQGADSAISGSHAHPQRAVADSAARRVREQSGQGLQAGNGQDMPVFYRWHSRRRVLRWRRSQPD